MSLIHSGLRAVFFDAVGTLIVPRIGAPEVYRTLAAKQGVQLDANLVRERFVAAYRVEEASDRAAGWVTSEERERERWRAIVTTTLSDLPDPEAGFLELFEHFARPDSWRLNDGAATVLESFAERGLILGLGTNYDSRVERVIAGLPELSRIADRAAISAAVGFRKPAVEFFRRVTQFAGCSPHDILFVGDDLENDYDGARSSGLEALLLDPKGEANVERRIASLVELIG